MGKAKIVVAVLAAFLGIGVGSGGEVTAAESSIFGNPPPHESAEPMACCRICTQGKACGNSCIARDKICHQGAGCACDG